MRREDRTDICLSDGSRLFSHRAVSARLGFLVDQLHRASLSIAANIAEGDGHFTKADRKSFFGIARGSVQECVLLLELAGAVAFSPKSGIPASNRIWKRFPGSCLA
jgi:four helix bundle protein